MRKLQHHSSVVPSKRKRKPPSSPYLPSTFFSFGVWKIFKAPGTELLNYRHQQALIITLGKSGASENHRETWCSSGWVKELQCWIRRVAVKGTGLAQRTAMLQRYKQHFNQEGWHQVTFLFGKYRRAIIVARSSILAITQCRILMMCSVITLFTLSTVECAQDYRNELSNSSRSSTVSLLIMLVFEGTIPS